VRCPLPPCPGIAADHAIDAAARAELGDEPSAGGLGEVLGDLEADAEVVGVALEHVGALEVDGLHVHAERCLGRRLDVDRGDVAPLGLQR
jgi:hypothetical protein